MYSVSEVYKTQVKEATRDWAIKLALSLDSGESYNLTEADVATGTFTYTESATCGDTIQVGSMYSNSLDFSLINRDGKFNSVNFQDAVVIAQVGLQLPDGTREWISLGKFNVYEPGKKLSTISMKCLDDMYKLNVLFVDVGVKFPINVATLATTICSYCNVSISSQLTTELLNLGITLDTFDTTDLTCRDVLGYVGCLIGKNLRFDRSGILESFWYSDTTTVTTDPDSRISSDFGDLKVNITGVNIVDASGNAYSIGTPDLVADLDTNPLIQYEQVAEEVLSTIYTSLSSVAYRPYSVQYIGDPAIQAGDRVLHLGKSNSGVYTGAICGKAIAGEAVCGTNTQSAAESILLNSVIMTSTFTFHGGATLSAVGTSAEQSRQATRSTKQVQQIVAQTRKDLNQGLQSLESSMLAQSDLITQALGFYPYVEYNDNGSIKAYYLMSTPNNTPTTTVWAFTSGGIGLSHTGIEGPYTSSWTLNDSIVANVITANMLRTGVLQSADGTSFYLDLDNGVLRMDASSIALNGKQLGDFIDVSYDTFGRPVLRLGWSGNDILLKLLNDRISFSNSEEEELAYWTTSSFRLKTLQSFQLGNMKMVAQANGSVSFIKGDS